LKVYRARGLRGPWTDFDPLDSSGSVGGINGWRFNDKSTEILYTAEVESLAVLEVAVRPGLETILQIVIAQIELPDDAVAELHQLGMLLPSNWNARPVANDSRTIAREFLDTVAAMPGKKPIGLRVPSVLSATNHNVLIDPSRKGELTHKIIHRLPFDTLRNTGS